jgi:hypothetical protein
LIVFGQIGKGIKVSLIVAYLGFVQALQLAIGQLMKNTSSCTIATWASLKVLLSLWLSTIAIPCI